MAFDRVVAFDRTKPPGEKIRGEALDEFKFYIDKLTPITGKAITRATYNSTTQKLTIYAYDYSTKTEGVLSEVPISSTVTGGTTMVETSPGSRLFRPVTS